jgi:hypothetical protein
LLAAIKRSRSSRAAVLTGAAFGSINALRIFESTVLADACSPDTANNLRRLRLHGLTERIPKTHRFRITAKGFRTAIFYTGLYNRSLRTGLALISPRAANPQLPMAKSIRAAETAVNKWYQHEKLAA